MKKKSGRNPSPAFRALCVALDASTDEHGVGVTWLMIDAWFARNPEALLRHLASHASVRSYICSILDAVPQADAVLAHFAEARAGREVSRS